MILNALEEGAGPPLCLLHGLFGAARNLGTVQRPLAKRFRTIGLDLRNHGASPHAEGMDYATQAADVRETLAALKALPAVLLGHSMGGKVAMELALGEGAAVRALIVIDVAPVPYPPHFRGFARAMAALPLRPGLTRRAADAALASTIPEPRVRGFLLQNLHTGETPSWRNGLSETARGLPAIEDFAPPPGASYPGPALFVAGARSDYLRPVHHPVIKKLFPAAEFATIAEAGHWVHAEQPAALLEALSRFLAAAVPA